MDKIKIVTVGDGSIGKNKFLWAFAKNEIPPDYVPTVVDNIVQKINFKGKDISLQIWDTSAADDLEGIRVLSYAKTNIFLICFNIADQVSLENAEKKWLAEIRNHVNNPFIFLVGLNSELRNDESTNNELAQKNVQYITYEQGKAKANETKIDGYCECSLKSVDSVKAVFDQALDALYKSKNDKHCIIY